jgi:hypothetical protein
VDGFGVHWEASASAPGGLIPSVLSYSDNVMLVSAILCKTKNCRRNLSHHLFRTGH